MPFDKVSVRVFSTLSLFPGPGMEPPESYPLLVSALQEALKIRTTTRQIPLPIGWRERSDEVDGGEGALTDGPSCTVRAIGRTRSLFRLVRLEDNSVIGVDLSLISGLGQGEPRRCRRLHL